MKYIQYDIIEAFKISTNTVLAHQDNCTSFYKAGFAKKLYTIYPVANPKQVMKRYWGQCVYVSSLESGNAICNMYAQYYPSSPSEKLGNYLNLLIPDSFENRTKALVRCLKVTQRRFQDKQIIMPLVSSGLAKDKSKEYTSDLDYFKRYIEPILLQNLNTENITVYYL